MAKGYWLATGKITDPKGFMPYVAAAEPYLEKCGANIIIRDIHSDIREGDPGHLTVLIEFPSIEAAKSAYEAPEYQEMIKLRTPYSDCKLSILVFFSKLVLCYQQIIRNFFYKLLLICS